MATTSIAELRDSALGTEISVPGFCIDEVLTFKVKRPSLIEMVADGKIPNPLLDTAASLFKSGAGKSIEELKESAGKDFKKIAEAMHLVVRCAMVEPSYDDLKDNGISLTDVQVMYIYNYIMDGVDRLRRFRTNERDHTNNQSGDGVQPETK